MKWAKILVQIAMLIFIEGANMYCTYNKIRKEFLEDRYSGKVLRQIKSRSSTGNLPSHSENSASIHMKLFQ